MIPAMEPARAGVRPASVSIGMMCTMRPLVPSAAKKNTDATNQNNGARTATGNTVPVSAAIAPPPALARPLGRSRIRRPTTGTAQSTAMDSAR